MKPLASKAPAMNHTAAQTASPEPSISVEGVVKNFPGVVALAGISADILPGRLTGLVGPDGAGKTTLMRLMAGLLRPDQGSITLLGRDTVREQGEIAHLAGYMPQRFGLYEDLSVAENLHLRAELYGLAPDAYPVCSGVLPAAVPDRGLLQSAR